MFMAPLKYFFPVLALASLSLGDFYVSPRGNDHNNGTKENPFRTLAKAQLAVREVNSAMKSDIKVLVAPGTYNLERPLNFTAVDSGFNGYRVIWEAQDVAQGANISGGLTATDWKCYDKAKGIYAAKIPPGVQSRHLFVDQKHAQRARKSLNRSWLSPFSDGYNISNAEAEFLLTLPGLEKAEIVGVNSFTHRFSPIARAGDNKSLIMKQPAFTNNVAGYDTLTHPDNEHGFYVENSLALLDEDNEWYLDSGTSTVYYKPAAGQDVHKMYIVLGRLEQLLVLSGTYDAPVHDLTFRGFNYMHTTWNFPSSDLGYVDQQTGGFIGENTTYRGNFEASRPHWWQIPGSIQVSAAHDITFQNGSLVAIMGGIGIANDANAHTSAVGLGASNIEISGMNFLQTGANAITLGGIKADAHHPSDDRMKSKDNRILENIFKEVAVTVTSGVPILVTYTIRTQVIHNDISDVPYSGICYGYGWGSNDAGGSPDYANRGLYNFQPRYTTPTIMEGGYIARNLIQNYGTSHSDLGGIYTLSKSPNTSITENWILYSPSRMAGLYHDEGSRNYVDSNSVFQAGTPSWLWRNEKPTHTTGNLTVHGIAVNQKPNNANNTYGDRVFDVTQWSSYSDLTAEQKSWVHNAGIPPDQRSYRPVSTRASTLSEPLEP